jgi:hypothetical protein
MVSQLITQPTVDVWTILGVGGSVANRHLASPFTNLSECALS